jgi:hypothetical protein
MQPRGVAKLSVSVPRDLARSLRRRIGPRGLSAFAARALRHELERAELGELIAELDDALGPVPEPLLEEARRAWQSS